MAKSYETSLDEIAHLIKHYEINAKKYNEASYKEAQARQEFIDPLFSALGWDVHNIQRVAPDYREVVIEDSIEIEGQKKAPDYVFRVGRDRKFFVEAKKPGVDIKNSSSPAYQLRRYAWSAKLSLSILTDFEELSIYDCRFRPSEKDKAANARINYFNYKEYPDRWREIFDIFSRDAVWGGSFDNYARDGKKGKGTSAVDAEFLKEIEGWRDSLAKNIALRNEKLSIDQLNDAVQKTIDRIIFLRMAEDRKIEEYQRLARIAEKDNIYKSLLNMFKQADDKYNSGLFDFSKEGDRVTPSIDIDDKVLSPILTGLYYPKSPYEFSVLPSETLGNIYEQFLGKVIRLTDGHRAKVEEKPEVKKAGGVYYTPAYIVDYIVKHTIGESIKNKSPKDLKGFRVLDMACGSGSFLIGAYQFMLEWYLEWYVNNKPETHDKEVRETNGSYKLTTNERKRILIEHIYGVDIDRQAVEVTKLSLLLKVLEGESDETIDKQRALFNERALPSLEKNIKCGNSLIGPDYFNGKLIPDEDELKRVNPFDWAVEFPDAMKVGGFDCVIGNPPYTYMINLDEQKYYSVKFKNQDYQKDLYLLFLERYHCILKQKGLLGVIVSNTWLSSLTYVSIRKYLASSYIWERILYLPEKVFNATVDTHVLIFNKDSNPSSNAKVVIDIYQDNQFSLMNSILLADISKNGQPINITINPIARKVYDNIINNYPQLSVLTEIYNGVKPFEKGKGKPPQTTKTMEEKPFVSEGVKPGKGWVPLLRGSLMHRYINRWKNDYWIQYGEWLAAPRDPKIFSAPLKIIVRQTGDSLLATIVDDTYIERDNLHIILPKNDINLHYLLGLINSKLLDFIYENINPEKGEALAQVKKNHVEQLPIRTIDFSDPSDKEKHDRMVTLVESMLDLHKKKAAADGDTSAVERMIAATDSQIDALVYELYGLTEEEIKIVEGKNA